MEGGGTLQEWGGRRTVMDAFPAMDCYEDMFKEITRKLYGEDGLPDMTEGDHSSSLRTASDYDGETPDSGHGALAAFGLAALMQNGFPPPPGMFGHHHHHLQAESLKYRSSGEDKWISSEETLQWTSSKIATYNSAQKLFRCTECECVGFLSRVAEHWLGTHANLRVFQCPQCPYASAWARCVRMHLQRQHNILDTPDNSTELWKENPVLEEVTKYLQRLKTRVESNSSQSLTNSSSHSTLKTEFGSAEQNHGPGQNSASSRSGGQGGGSENTPSKRYCCTFCPYATDRRDLFTRHENIHRDEKPFQCYVCQKQFNRADHVKKHFLRMHRDHPYDLNRIRKHPPKNSNGVSYYQKYNSSQPTGGGSRSQILPSQGQMGPHGLNIPAGFAPPQAIRGVKPSLTSPPKLEQNGCNGKSKPTKKKGEKRYSCCYCAWSGVDNWCLKRHLNTHLKPFVCGLCDYKAARSERLATHVLKVHNKRACGRCSFLGEDSAQLATHMQEQHPLEHRNRSSNSTTRGTNFTNNHNTSALTSFCVSSNSNQSSRRHYDESSTPGGLWNPHGHISSSYSLPEDGWKSSSKHFGAARLFHYMEASDNSEPENEHEEEEPPPFICRECGCEFVDDTSLETHVFMHHRSTGQRSVKQEPIRGVTDANINLSDCSTQRAESPQSKRPRKQQQPKKIVPTTEIQVVRRCRRRRLKNPPAHETSYLRNKHISRLIMRKRARCFWCRSWNQVFPYHTSPSLVLHKMWRHRRYRFNCEHCGLQFEHRYQVILHSSRSHSPRLSREQIPSQSPKRSCQRTLNPHVNEEKDSATPQVNGHFLTRLTSASEAVRDDRGASVTMPSSLVSLRQSNPSSNFFHCQKSLQQIEIDPTDSSKSLESSEPKTYQVLNKVDIDRGGTSVQALQNLNRTMGKETSENSDSFSSLITNNNLMTDTGKESKDSTNESLRVDRFIRSSCQTQTTSDASMPLIIPFYPPPR